MDRDIAAKFVNDDEGQAAIVRKFITQVPSPSGRRLAAAGLLASVVGTAVNLRRRNESELRAAAVRAF